MKNKVIAQRILTADEGMMLTNGETYGKTVVLPASADASVWTEITEEQYEESLRQQEAEEP